jgi:hypothetical protein
MSWPGEEGSLRDLIKWGILSILEQLEIVIWKMEQEGTGRGDLTYQVAALAEGLQELEARITRLEEHKNTISWLLGLSAAMSFGVLLAYLIGLLR